VFATLPRRRHRERVWEVPLLPDAPLTHEWFIIFDSPAFSACLAGRERGTGHRADAARERSRRFEALWTIEATAVRGAAQAACALAFERFPELVDVVEPHWQSPPVTRARSATQLTNRIVRRLDLAKWRT
jgi:DICT domain-containing protein